MSKSTIPPQSQAPSADHGVTLVHLLVIRIQMEIILS